MIGGACLLGALCAIAFSGFYSGSETGLYCLNHVRLRLDAEAGDRRALRLARLVEHDQSALSTLLVGTNIANYLATVAVAYLLTRSLNINAGASEIYTTVIVTPVIFVFGEVVPKIIYQRHADHLMRLGSWLFSASARVLRVPVMALNFVSRPILKMVDPAGLIKTDPRRRIVLLLQEALATDDASGDHSEYVDRVLGLSTVPLHQVMVPRNRIVSIRADAGRKEFLSLIRKHRHSRLPVYERDPRRIVGLIHVHDLLADPDWTEIRQHLRGVPSVPAHDSVASTIVQLQSARQTMAILVDRSGYLLGLVTLKDLLEELTGELHEW